MTEANIWRPDRHGAHAVRVVPPYAWHGEPDCVIGPFSSRDIARRFSGFGEDFGHFDLGERVFAHRDAWYVEVETPRA